MKMLSTIRNFAICFFIIGLAASGVAGDIVGTVTAKKKKYIPNTIVYVDGVKGDFAPPKEPVIMNQEQMQFHPHILPILKGTMVDFLNSDEVAHNVFSPDEVADKFNLGTWPKGEKKSHAFDKECEVVCQAVMLCNVHPDMEAFVVVFQNPYFAKVDEEGKFEIKDIPAGEYTLKVWNPKKGAPDQKVIVADTGATQLSLKLGKKKK